LDKTAAPIPSN